MTKQIHIIEDGGALNPSCYYLVINCQINILFQVFQSINAKIQFVFKCRNVRDDAFICAGALRQYLEMYLN